MFVDKPIGISSTDVVRQIKKMLYSKKELGKPKIGHAGTLDVLAEGVLPIAIGEATKLIDHVMSVYKTYEFIVQFGVETTTADAEGEVVSQSDVCPSQEEILAIIPRFIGEIVQTPPKYSAIKINGQRAYNLARNNCDFEVPSRNVTIKKLDLLYVDEKTKQAKFVAKVSKGTYIRSLACDIAFSLNTVCFVKHLRRTSYDFQKEILLVCLDSQYNICNDLYSIEDMLDDIPAYPLNLSQAKMLFNGNTSMLNMQDFVTNSVNIEMMQAIYNGKLIALLRFVDNKFNVIRVFNHHKNNI